MGANSVNAVIGAGNYDCKHFPLALAKGRLALHERAVKVHGGFHDPWTLAHDADNVPDPAGAIQGHFVFSPQRARGTLNRNNFNPGHGNLSRDVAD